MGVNNDPAHAEMLPLLNTGARVWIVRRLRDGHDMIGNGSRGEYGHPQRCALPAQGKVPGGGMVSLAASADKLDGDDIVTDMSDSGSFQTGGEVGVQGVGNFRNSSRRFLPYD